MAAVADIEILALAVRACFDRSAIGGLVQASKDDAFARLVPLAARHRVEGQLWDGACQAGLAEHPFLTSALRAKGEAIAADHLVGLARCREIGEAFDREGLALQYLKGRALAALTYPRPQVKESCDIDILVRSDQLVEAADVLVRLGFRQCVPASPAQLQPWHKLRKESVWIDPDNALQLDLHTRPIDNPSLAPALCGEVPSQAVDAGHGIMLATFAQPYLYGYLCLHGASSAWFRLSWLTDLAALLHAMRAADIEELHRSAVGMGAGAASGQALVLLHRLFQLDVPQHLLRDLNRSRVIGWLCGVAWSQLTSYREPAQRKGGTVSIHLSQCLLGSTIGHAPKELLRQGREWLTRP